MASTFTLPTVRDVAIIWRLQLETLTLSASTMVRCLMPERTRLSAHQPPTPPTPKMITLVRAMRSIASEPSSSSPLWKNEGVTPLAFAIS